MQKTPVDFDLLSIFVAVADQASFSKAAHALGITKGTVSRAIARLEARVGAELIHRTTHRVALSTAGTALYERAAPHLLALEQAVCKLPELAERPSGLLRLTAPHDLGGTLLPSVLAQFSLRYPEISFELRLTNVRIDLVAEGFDLAIRASQERLADSSLTARRIGGGELRIYAAPAYLARRGEPRELGDPAHEWVSFPTPPKRAPKRFHPRFVADDFFLVRDLLREGVGVGLLPTFLAEPYVRAGSLAQVLPATRVRGPGGYFLVYPSSGQVPRKVAAFRDFLLESVQAQPLD